VPLVAAALLLAGCTTSAPVPAPSAAPAVERAWGYKSAPGVAGPAEWASLPGAAACANGKRQSPVDLGTKPPAPVEGKVLPKLVFRYGATSVHLVNDGHTIQADVDKGSAVEIDGVKWPLLQFHFHAPSEHSLDGFHYPMEIHFVHGGKDGRPGLVVAVFVVQGGENPALASVLASLPKEKGTRRDDARTVDLTQLLPPDRTYLAYDGSLTTPPCTEGIRWIVLEMPLGVRGEQLGAFTALPDMAPTNRPAQPLQGRRYFFDAPVK
jgi:carbonic anhydrase